MKAYIGTKIVLAEPMDKETFETEINGQDYDGENMPGYLVKYEDGYMSWSPKDVFEHAYRLMTSSEAEHSANNLPDSLQLLDVSEQKEEGCNENMGNSYCIMEDLANVIRKHSIDSKYNVKDVVLTNYLLESLEVFAHYKNMVLVDEAEKN